MRLLPSFLRDRSAVAKAANFVTDLWAWRPMIRESFAGAWQRNISVDNRAVIAHHAVYACATLIAGDVSKLRVKLVSLQDGVWTETTNPAYSPVLRRPNGYQTRIQFWEHYILSKLLRGNTYVLKQRDSRNVVVGLHVLDPSRCLPMLSPSGDVFYQVQPDYLAELDQPQIVPGSEVIHDRWNCLFHPLVGMSPIYASGLTATQGMAIQHQSIDFFRNRAQPSGILTAPGKISEETAARLKAEWDDNYRGENAGRTAVLGEGLKWEATTMTAVEGQVIEQLRWSAEVVCSTFHVPPYKIGHGAVPPYNNIQALNVEYYSTCLQVLIEAAELCLDDGLGLGSDVTVWFDVDGLLRMDSVSQMLVLKEGVGAGVLAPNEARAKLDYKKARGGDTPYLQQQNFSLAALDKRDAKDDPFATSSAAKLPADVTPPPAAPAGGGNGPPPPPPAKEIDPRLVAIALEHNIRRMAA